MNDLAGNDLIIKNGTYYGGPALCDKERSLASFGRKQILHCNLDCKGGGEEPILTNSSKYFVLYAVCWADV